MLTCLFLTTYWKPVRCSGLAGNLSSGYDDVFLTDVNRSI